MDRLDLDSKTWDILELCSKARLNCFDSFDESLSDEQRHEYNSRDLLNDKIFLKVSYKPDSAVQVRPMAIPVGDSTIAAYYFTKPSGGVDSLNSLIIYFHGGGWMLGNMDRYQNFCNRVCSLTGASVLSVDYRLAPQYRFPVPVEDCYSSLLWIEKGLKYLGIDQDKVYLMGDGTGGNLAIAVSLLARDRKGPKIAGQILMCPCTDGRMRTASYEEYAQGPVLSSKMMSCFYTNYVREPKDILDPLVSPLCARDLSRLPETLIFAAQYDVLCDDGVLFSRALNAADTPVKLIKAAKTVHGFYNFRKARFSEEFFNAVAQYVGGRALDRIEMLSNSQMKSEKRRKNQALIKLN